MVTLAVMALFLAVLIIPTLRSYLHQRSQINTLGDQVATQRKDVNNLEQQRDRWANPAYVQQQARQRLGFAKPGEKAYIVIDDQGTKRDAAATGRIAREREHADLPWYGQLWESVKSSGGTTPAK